MKQILFKCLIALIAMGLGNSASAQVPYATTTSDIVLTGGAYVPGEGGGVAYNPTLQLYYANVAGLTTNPFETFSNTGVLLSSVVGNFDPRGAWWNPILGQLEMNTYNSQGIHAVNLNALGYALGTNTFVQTPTNSQPNAQSLGQYDWINNHFIYYNAGSITRVNRATNTVVSTTPVTGLPATTVTAFAVGVFNVPNYEIALYDYVNKRVYFINGSTYAHTFTTQLPMVTPGVQSMYNVGWANNRIFLCNTSGRTWTGYPLFPDGCDTVFYEQVVNVCENQMPYTWNGMTFTAAGDSLARFHWPAASVQCDSVTYLTLVVNPAPVTNIEDSIYFGSVYNFFGNALSSDGIYRHVLPSSAGCDSTIQLNLKVIPVNRLFVDTLICEYDYYYHANRKYNTQGIHRDTFVYSDHHEILVLDLKVRRKPTVEAMLVNKDINNLCIGEDIVLNGEGAIRYEWYKIDEPLNELFNKTPVLNGWVYDSFTNIRLRGFDDLNCYNDFNFVLQGKNCCQIFIPNAFTPNGDGLNDEFMVKGVQPKWYRAQVFNRYGTLVFDSNNINDGWSGKDNAGKDLPNDVYYYYIQGDCFDGTKIQEKGDITLIR